MSVAETAMWVRGDLLVRWLERLGIIDLSNLKPLGDRWERSVRAWSNEGRRSHVYTVDEFLCAIGVCLGEMPEEFYIEDNVRKGFVGIDSTTKERIAALRRNGWTQREIAAMVGVDAKTVRAHLRKAELA